MDRQDREARVGFLEMVVAMLVSGSIGVFVTESGQSATNVVFFRCLIAALCLLPYCYFKGLLKAEHLTIRNLLIMSAGGICIVLNWVFFFESYALTSISLATIVYHVNPFIILALGAIFLGARVGPTGLLWTAVAFGGLFLVINPGLETHSDLSAHLRGLGYVLLATTLYSFTVIVTKKVSDVPPPVIILVQATIGIPLLLPLADLSVTPSALDQWFFLISLGVIHTFFLYSLLFSAYQKLTIISIAILSFIYPLSTVVFDILIYDKILSTQQLIGFSLVMIATLGVKLNWNLTTLNRLALGHSNSHSENGRKRETKV